MQAGILNFFTTYPFAVPFIVAVGVIFFIIWFFTYRSLKKDIKDLSEGQKKDIKGLSERITEGQKDIKGLSERMTEGQKDIKGLSERITEGQKDIKNLSEGQKNIKELFIAKLDPIERGLNNHVKTEIMKLREDMNKKIDNKFEKIDSKVESRFEKLDSKLDRLLKK